MLLRVPARLRIRHRAWVDARDGVLQPHLWRETAVVLMLPLGEIGGWHAPTLVRHRHEGTDRGVVDRSGLLIALAAVRRVHW
jgi:hypothetical protein